MTTIMVEAVAIALLVAKSGGADMCGEAYATECGSALHRGLAGAHHSVELLP